MHCAMQLHFSLIYINPSPEPEKEAHSGIDHNQMQPSHPQTLRPLNDGNFSTNVP